jgi:hypothetical protein
LSTHFALVVDAKMTEKPFRVEEGVAESLRYRLADFARYSRSWTALLELRLHSDDARNRHEGLLRSPMRSIRRGGMNR